MKLNVKSRKFVSVSKFVTSKKSLKSKVKDKVFIALSIEVNSDNEKNKNKKNKKKKKKKKKNDENDEKKNDEKKKNDENVERINAFLIVKKLFDQKNYEIIDFKRRVNNVKEDHINVSNISNFEKNEIISSANKKNINEIFTLITKTYNFA